MAFGCSAPRCSLIVALVLAVAVGCVRPGAVTGSYESGNGVFKIRIVRRDEISPLGMPGAYYEFSSAPANSDSWSAIVTFRHDDSVDIPRDQIRFLNAGTGYFFMGWVYGVTRDRGKTWKLWSAENDLPHWECCNYTLIRDVSLGLDGVGSMTLDVIDPARGEVPLLTTRDFGVRWDQ